MEVIEVSGYVPEEKLAIAKVKRILNFILVKNFYLELFNSISN